MYDSLKPWINVPVSVKKFIKRDGTGDKIFAAPHTVLCYPEGGIKVVRDSAGVEVTSTSQLYMLGTADIGRHDTVTFDGDERPIKAITSYYSNGIVDLKVVYL